MLLECSQVSRRYEERQVLDGVSFGLEAGELLVLLGASGSGKSTLLRLLNRLEEPDSGEISFRGQPATATNPLELRRRVALVMQTPILFEGSVLENLQRRPKGAAVPDEAELAAELAQLGLDESFLQRAAKELSGGEKQRVSLVRSMALRPDVLLVDEPTSALDPRHEGRVAEYLLRAHSERGAAVIVVTHSPGLDRRLGTSARRGLLTQGHLELDPSDSELQSFFEGLE